MKTKAKYVVYIIIILILSAVIPGMLTNAKYFYNVNLESDIAIKNIIFKIEQKENEPEVYEMHPNEEVTAKYELKNFDDDNNINETNLKYYIKITDDLDNENLPLEIIVDGYSYISYNTDENRNIINSDGDITDELGNVLQEQNLTEKENEELQATLQNVKKGYGPITLEYDGETKDTNEIDIKINCPEEYIGDEELQFKIVIIAEGENINSKAESDLKIKIVQEENSENIEEPQNDVDEEPEEPNANEEQNYQDPLENSEENNPEENLESNLEPQNSVENSESQNNVGEVQNTTIDNNI